jgi:hypothetical protein
MSPRAVLVSLGLVALSAASFAAAPANSFNLVSTAGKNIGNASYTISKDKNGYHIVGKFQYRLGSSMQAESNTGDTHMSSGVMFNEGQFTEDFKVSEDGNFISGYTQNSTNQIMTSFQPNKAGTELTVNQIQGGIGLGSHDLELPKPNFLVVPDFDPGSLQLFLTTALAHPHNDKTYLFVVPAGSNPRGRENALYITLQLAPDTLEGTLDGKPVKVMHYLMGYHVGKADLYTDDAGTLMQADMGLLNTSYIRAKFALTSVPAK